MEKSINSNGSLKLSSEGSEPIDLTRIPQSQGDDENNNFQSSSSLSSSTSNLVVQNISHPDPISSPSPRPMPLSDIGVDGGGGKRSTKFRGKNKIDIEFITKKSRRQSTFSKRKTGLMKKAYELAELTGAEVLLMIASDTNHVYTYGTTKMKPVFESEQGKLLIEACLNSNTAPSNGCGGGGSSNGDGIGGCCIPLNQIDQISSSSDKIVDFFSLGNGNQNFITHSNSNNNNGTGTGNQGNSFIINQSMMTTAVTARDAQKHIIHFPISISSNQSPSSSSSSSSVITNQQQKELTTAVATTKTLFPPLPLSSSSSSSCNSSSSSSSCAITIGNSSSVHPHHHQQQQQQKIDGTIFVPVNLASIASGSILSKN